MKNPALSQKQNRLFGLGLIFIGLLVLAVAVVLSLPPAEDTAPAVLPADLPQFSSVTPARVNFAAPEIALTGLNGKPDALSEYRNQVVLVNNWAVWCPPCKVEMPHLQAYYETHKKQGFVIVGIESGSSKAQVQEFVSQAGLTFPIWLDPGEQVIQAFNNYNLPSSYLVDQNGQVVLAWTGAISVEMLERYVTPYLAD